MNCLFSRLAAIAGLTLFTAGCQSKSAPTPPPTVTACGQLGQSCCTGAALQACGAHLDCEHGICQAQASGNGALDAGPGFHGIDGGPSDAGASDAGFSDAGFPDGGHVGGGGAGGVGGSGGGGICDCVVSPWNCFAGECNNSPPPPPTCPNSNLSDPRLPDPTTVSHRHHASGAVPGANTALSDPAAAAAALPAPTAATTALPHAAALSDAAARRGFLPAATALLWNVLPSSSCLPRAAPMLALTLQSIIQVATQTISSALRRLSGLALLAACLIGPRAEAAWDGGSHALRIDHPHSALEEGAVHSIESKTRASLQFVNLTGKDLELFWLDFTASESRSAPSPRGRQSPKRPT